MRTALSIAGSDSVGGAGIQADIKAMTAVGVHATTVITAVTAQNTCKVRDILPIPPEMIQEQLKAILEDCDIRAIKTGMLYDAETVHVVAETLERHNVPLVVDPVMVATVGDELSDKTLVRALKEDLLPMCELVTPNKHEAEVLANMKISNEDDAMFACETIGKEGSSVLLKGGHMDTKTIVDYLYLSSEFTEIKNPRLNDAGHGSGCVLSAYITANMANGNDLVNSVMRSRELMQEAIASQYDIGKGVQVVNPNVRGGNDKVKYSTMEAVDEAARRIVDIMPHELVPRGGMNIAYAMPNAAGPEEIAAIDGRIKVHNGMMVKGGQAKLGSAEHLSYIILESMRTDPDIRCVLNIGYAKDTEDIMEEVGLSISRLGKKGNKSIATLTHEAISKKGSGFPDAIIDKDDGTIKILGKNPNDVMNKLESIL